MYSLISSKKLIIVLANVFHYVLTYQEVSRPDYWLNRLGLTLISLARIKINRQNIIPATHTRRK